MCPLSFRNRQGKIYIDGASRGNPGAAGVGVVLCNQEGEVIEEIGRYLGEATNNVAEYESLLLALHRAKELGMQHVQVFSDSQLLARQINGQYQIRSAHLRSLYQQAKARMQEFDCVIVTYIPRTENRRADHIANRAVEEQQK